MLLEAEDKPISFEEMAAAGIPNPATAVYELEMSGLEIEHLATGVRLDKRLRQPRPAG